LSIECSNYHYKLNFIHADKQLNKTTKYLSDICKEVVQAFIDDQPVHECYLLCINKK